MSGVGKRIRERRESAGLSRAALSALAGVNDNMIAQWELGNHRPSARSLAKVAAALGCEPADLAGGEPIPDPTPVGPGFEVGDLVVRELSADRDRHGCALWLCDCRRCGGTATLTAAYLRSGRRKSCGCRRRGPQPRAERHEVLTGRRFGRLVAVERVPADMGAWRWRCRCDCGGVVEVLTGDLRGGGVRSCGCARKGDRPAADLPPRPPGTTREAVAALLPTGLNARDIAAVVGVSRARVGQIAADLRRGEKKENPA